jgi:hypothetical protein
LVASPSPFFPRPPRPSPCSSLSVQMANQMDALMSRLGDVLKPTTERLNRLERAVEKLAGALHTGVEGEDPAAGGSGLP